MSLNPSTLARTVVGTALEKVDYGLQQTALYVEKANHVLRPVSDCAELNHSDIDKEYHSYVAKLIEALRVQACTIRISHSLQFLTAAPQIKKGAPIDLSVQNALSIIDALVTSKFEGGMDDRLMLLEHVLVFLSRSPENTLTARTVHDKVVGLLYNDLAHPPASILGRKYRYRAADGYGTCIWNPEMGMAGVPYSRSVQGTHPLPPNQLPSPELVFDALLKREKQVEHPAGLSSLFFAFANLVIHQIFSTDHGNPNDDQQDPINLTSSYVDLSIVYGNNQKEQDSIRLRDGTGKIYNDTFADGRLLHMPPSSPALLVLFSRNHNYICETILEINERGWWSNPPPTDEAKRAQQDEDIFQTARLINCGSVMSVVLSDYLAGILGTVREGNSWSLDLQTLVRNEDHSIAPRGAGNVVSAEFAALYHFHATISKDDEKWVENMFRDPKMFGDTPWDKITVPQYKAKIQEIKAASEAHKDKPYTWTFGGLKRDPVTHKFNDADLARIILDATERPASAFKARGSPHAMKIIELMAIEQNRAWGTCSLNEFRKFLGLKPFSTFEEWNPRHDVADAARRLYGHPDNLELYVGLQAEESKPVMPGAGLCCGYTATRAILADAVALVRGDRFLTNDLTAFNLTAWGLKDATRNPDNSSNGGFLPKLFMRALPDYFPPDSVYTNFPLVTPSSMKTNLTKIHQEHKYTFTRPHPLGPLRAIKSYVPALTVLNSPSFSSVYPANAALVFPPHGGYLSTFNDIAKNNEDKRIILDAWAIDSNLKRMVGYLGDKTRELVRIKGFTLSGESGAGAGKRSVDVVKDVLRFIGVHLVADHVIGLPLKTETHTLGTFYEAELYDKLKEVYDFVFLDDIDPSTKVAREPQVKQTIDNLALLTRQHFARVKDWLVPGVGLVDTAIHLLLAQNATSHEWLRRLRHSTRKPDGELTNSIVALALFLSIEFGQALTNVIDVLLPPSPEPISPKLLRALQSSDETATNVLRGMIVDALKTRPVIPGVSRMAETDVPVPGGMVKRGDRVYVCLADAMTEMQKGEGKTIRGRHELLGDGLSRILGQDLLVTLLVPVVRTLLSLKDVIRAPGNSGRLDYFEHMIGGTETIGEDGKPVDGSAYRVKAFLDRRVYTIGPWASSLVVKYTE